MVTIYNFFNMACVEVANDEINANDTVIVRNSHLYIPVVDYCAKHFTSTKIINCYVVPVDGSDDEDRYTLNLIVDSASMSELAKIDSVFHIDKITSENEDDWISHIRIICYVDVDTEL